MSRTKEAKRFREKKRKASLSAAKRIIAGINEGTFELEHASCFCGSENSKAVAVIDRYGLPVQTVVCQECALIRLDPRPTEAQYARFYGGSDYRDLNHAKHLSEITNQDEEDLALLRSQMIKSTRLQSLLTEHAIEPPKIVVDIGCHFGGMLEGFAADGAKTYGVEIDPQARAKAEGMGHVVVATIDDLIAQGLKADLIIMQDFIEHLPDLKYLLKVRELMIPGKSVLYVWTPGLFRVQFESNSQIAHTYYFCSNTLHFVMNCMGFDATYCDEDCSSFWVANEALPNVVRKPTEWVEYAQDEIAGKENRKLPPFAGTCKFTKQELYENIVANLKWKRPDIQEIAQSEKGAVLILAGGPSIDNEIDEIKRLQAEGAKSIVIARMYPWCVEHGIKVDYVTSLDCSEDQELSFVSPQPDTVHLLSTVTRPSIFEKLKDHKVYIFDSRSEPKCRDLRREAEYAVATVVNGGGSVSVLSLSLAFTLGFRDVHMFGFDAMVTDKDTTHSKGIAGTSLKQRLMPVTVGDVGVLTTPQWIEFTRQAIDLISVAQQEQMLDSISIHGDKQCLINHMWDGIFYEDGVTCA